MLQKTHLSAVVMPGSIPPHRPSGHETHIASNLYVPMGQVASHMRAPAMDALPSGHPTHATVALVVWAGGLIK